jgi:hypothetical protein
LNSLHPWIIFAKFDSGEILTKCVMKHKGPRTMQIPEEAIIVKSQGKDFKIYDSNVNSPAEKPPFLGVPSDIVYSFFLGFN